MSPLTPDQVSFLNYYKDRIHNNSFPPEVETRFEHHWHLGLRGKWLVYRWHVSPDNQGQRSDSNAGNNNSFEGRPYEAYSRPAREMTTPPVPRPVPQVKIDDGLATIRPRNLRVTNASSGDESSVYREPTPQQRPPVGHLATIPTRPSTSKYLRPPSPDWQRKRRDSSASINSRPWSPTPPGAKPSSVGRPYTGPNALSFSRSDGALSRASHPRPLQIGHHFRAGGPAHSRIPATLPQIRLNGRPLNLDPFGPTTAQTSRHDVSQIRSWPVYSRPISTQAENPHLIQPTTSRLTPVPRSLATIVHTTPLRPSRSALLRPTQPPPARPERSRNPSTILPTYPIVPSRLRTPLPAPPRAVPGQPSDLNPLAMNPVPAEEQMRTRQSQPLLGELGPIRVAPPPQAPVPECSDEGTVPQVGRQVQEGGMASAAGDATRTGGVGRSSGNSIRKAMRAAKGSVKKLMSGSSDT